VTTQDLEHALRLQTQAAESRSWRLDLQIESLRFQNESLRKDLAGQQQCLLYLVGSLVFTSFCMLLAFAT
jgi:hypothetical protein